MAAPKQSGSGTTDAREPGRRGRRNNDGRKPGADSQGPLEFRDRLHQALRAKWRETHSAD